MAHCPSWSLIGEKGEPQLAQNMARLMYIPNARRVRHKWLQNQRKELPLKHIAKRSCLPLPTLALPTQRVNRRPRVNRRYSEDRPGAAVPPGANVMLTSLSMQIDTHQRPRWLTKAKIILPHTGTGLALIKNQHAPPRKKLIKARINGQMPHFCCSRSQAVRLRVENLKAALVNCRLL